MKHTYVSPDDFEKNCPCSSYLTSYAESLYPSSATISFVTGRHSADGTDTYTAKYDVQLKDAPDIFRIEVSCTILPDSTYQYAVIGKTDNL